MTGKNTIPKNVDVEISMPKKYLSYSVEGAVDHTGHLDVSTTSPGGVKNLEGDAQAVFEFLYKELPATTYYKLLRLMNRQDAREADCN
jgi:hypothetical protein